MRKLFHILLICLPLHAFAQTGSQPIKVTDMVKIRSVSGISLTKDGNRAVFTVTSIEPETDNKLEYKYVNQLWTVRTDGNSQPVQLTSKENASQASFSPDGKQIAFVRTVDNRPQIFLIRIDGGEALQLTKHRYGASAPRWSPDGRKIVFSANIPMRDLIRDSTLNPGKELPAWPLERPGFSNNDHLKTSTARANPDGSMQEIRAYLDNNVTDKKARVINKLNFQDESEINPDLGFNKYFIVDAVPDATPVMITPGYYRYNGAEFTPDGKHLIIAGNRDSLQHPDRALEGEIFIVNEDGTGFRRLLGKRGTTYNAPRISPSGKWLAYQQGETSFVTIPTLFIKPMNGDFAFEIPFDRNKQNVTWSEDEKYIYFSAQSNGGQPVYRVDLSKAMAAMNAGKVDKSAISQIGEFNAGISSFDVAGNKLIMVRTSVLSPFEIYLADALGRNEKRISSFNTEWLAPKKLSIPEKFSFVNEKGLTVEYWVMKPTNYEAGKKYPLLLEIHGGPASMWGPGEASMWHEYQYFCSKGYGVVYSNPRGSSGYGETFLRANINDWGAGPASDVLTALDKTIALGWADTSKLVITGGSYAGYLVTWIIAHDQRFKAACAQRGVYDLATFFGEGNAWRLVPNYFGGYPWEQQSRATLERESPINYVHMINTPFIIFHGENDRRTGFVQSEMLYRSLKVLGKPVEYVRHPGATHEITRSGNNRQRIDQMLRTYEFFERWIH